MGMQIKIKVTSKYKNFSNSIDTQYDLSKCMLTKRIEFNEYVKEGVTILIDAPECYYLSAQVPYQQEDILIKPNSSTILIPSDKDGVIPGKFHINIYNNMEFIGYFSYTIQPTSGQYSDILNLREYLEIIASGLSRDMCILGNTSIKDGISIAENDLEKLQYLYNNYNLISKTITKIVDDPLCNIVKEDKISHKIKRISNRTIRWLDQNQNIHPLNKIAPDTLLQSYSCLSYNINENMMLKSVLSNILQEISSIECNVSNRIEKLKNIYKKNNDQIINDEESEKKIKKKFAYKKAVKSKQNKIKYMKEDNKNYDKRINNLQSNFNKIKTLKLLFCRILHESFLSNIEPNYKIRFTKRILKSSEYHFIFDMYFKIINKKQNISDNNNLSYQFKTTDKLVEYYCLYLIIDILIKSFKFEWKSGWLADKNRIDNDIESGTILTLEKDDITIQLSYDKIIPHYNEVEKDYNGIVTKSIKTNDRPDIVLEIYINKTLKSYLVFECKHRKIEYIYDSNTPTDVQEQLIAYDNFVYYANAPLTKKVVCLYSLGKASIKSDDPFVKYIGVNYSNKPSETSTYTDIKKVLEEYLLF